MNKLQTWVAQGLITEQQRIEIQAYEAKVGTPWVTYSFLILGVTVLGLGVISLVAANWYSISDAVKLGIDFLLLVTIASYIYGSIQKNALRRADLLILLFFIVCLASLGLIAQIYNLAGTNYQLLLLWSVMTFLLATISTHMIVPLFWCIVFFIGFFMFCLDSALGSSVFQGQANIVAMNLALLSTASFFVVRSIESSGWTKALRLTTIGLWVITVLTTELRLLFRLAGTNTSQTFNIDIYILTFGLLFFALLFCFKNATYTRLQKSLLGLAMLLLMIFAALPTLDIKEPLVYALGTLTLLAIGSLIFASLNNRSLFNFCIILLAFRFLIVYFQALGGLATTGLGLIIVGLVIISIVSIWVKYQALIWNTIARLMHAE